MFAVLSSNLMAKNHILIDRVNSSSAQIGHVYLTYGDDHIVVNGKLTKSFNRRGRISGHLHIEAYDSSGNKAFESITKYHRHRRNARSSHLIQNIPLINNGVSRIKITHHDLSVTHG
jgi:hypothetical protein